MTFLAEYPWRQVFTALHVISVISWMAGMLYLPRLFVYHADSAKGSEKSETFKVMERRLLRGIINPAMIGTWAFGLILVMTPGVVDWGQPYAWVKAVAVIAMSALHGNLSRWRKDFEADRNTRPARFYRIVNEVPTVLMVIIVMSIFLKF